MLYYFELSHFILMDINANIFRYTILGILSLIIIKLTI